jgi:hypothetical protein
MRRQNFSRPSARLQARLLATRQTIRRETSLETQEMRSARSTTPMTIAADR